MIAFADREEDSLLLLFFSMWGNALCIVMTRNIQARIQLLPLFLWQLMLLYLARLRVRVHLQAFVPEVPLSTESWKHENDLSVLPCLECHSPMLRCPTLALSLKSRFIIPHFPSSPSLSSLHSPLTTFQPSDSHPLSSPLPSTQYHLTQSHQCLKSPTQLIHDEDARHLPLLQHLLQHEDARDLRAHCA